MTDLKDLLRHEIKDLYSVEEQIIEAMPQMIEKANNPQLKQGLERHLRITEEQLKRLDQVKELMDQDHHEIQERKNSGLFARLMRRHSQENESDSGEEKCLGMEGIIKESKKMLAEEMEPSVLDAAIIACAQKIEHYEICGYGTARAYARELNLDKIAELLEQTLNEENEADDRLTDMAVGKVNKEAEMGDGRRSSRSSASSSSRSSSRTAAPGTSRSRAGAALAASNSQSGGASSGRDASRTSRSTSSSGRSGSSTSGRSAGRTKAATKTSSRGGSAAPAGKASSSRSTSKSTGRSASTGKTRTATATRTKKAATKVASKAASKTAATKGGRSSSTSRTTSKSSGRGSSNGRSSGRR